MSLSTFMAMVAAVLALAACLLAALSYLKTRRLEAGVREVSETVNAVVTAAEEAVMGETREARKHALGQLVRLCDVVYSSRNPLVHNAAVAELLDRKAEWVSIHACERGDLGEDEADAFYTPINVKMRAITRPWTRGKLRLKLSAAGLDVYAAPPRPPEKVAR